MSTPEPPTPQEIRLAVLAAVAEEVRRRGGTFAVNDQSYLNTAVNGHDLRLYIHSFHYPAHTTYVNVAAYGPLSGHPDNARTSAATFKGTWDGPRGLEINIQGIAKRLLLYAHREGQKAQDASERKACQEAAAKGRRALLGAAGLPENGNVSVGGGPDLYGVGVSDLTDDQAAELLDFIKSVGMAKGGGES